MINEGELKDALLSIVTDARTNYIMLSSTLNELAALRETVRGLDPTFGDVMEQQRAASEKRGAEIVQRVIAGYDLIIEKLKEGYVC